MKPVASASRNGSREQALVFFVVAAIGGSLLLRDAHNGHVECVREDHGAPQVAPCTSAAATERYAATKDDKNLVANGGFDAFVGNHGDALTSSPATVSFVVPIRLEAMHLQVHHIGDENVGARLVRRSRLSVAGWSGGLLLQFDTFHGAVSPRWLRVEGMSNVGDGNAHNVVVHIPFPPHKCGMHATTANVATIASMPLTRTRPLS